MANMTSSRIGQANGGGDARVNFLKVFGGEVLSAFSETNVTGSRTMKRTISSGKSASFPASWKATAAYHTPGTQLVGTAMLSNERVITIDDVLIADIFVPDIDVALSHFEFRSEYSKQAGAALAKACDKNLLQLGYLAARAATTVTGGNGGTAITSATSKTDADALVTAVSDAAQALDEKDVPEADRYLFLKPDQYYLLVNSGSKSIHMDYTGGQSNGSVASGKIFKLFGFEIVKSNNLPTTNINTGVAAYQVDATNSTALAMHRSAVGTVSLVDLAVESQYLIEYQGDLLLAKMAVGHGILRPESAVEIKTA